MLSLKNVSPNGPIAKMSEVMVDSTSVVLFETVELSGGKQLGLITLNVEKTLNSLSLEMVDLIHPQLARWERDDAIGLVMFQGAGDRAFCAGGDIQNLYHDMVAHPGGPCPYCEAFFEREYRLDYYLHNYSKPTIVWAHGVVMGGGLGIASACDFRIGTEKTRIAMPEITIGLIPDAGATWSFMQMDEHWAYFLAWTGAAINGADALRVKLVNALINHSDRQDFIDDLARADWGAPAQQVISNVIDKFEQKRQDFPASQIVNHEKIVKEVIAECLQSDNPVATLIRNMSQLSGDSWLEKAAATFSHGAPTTAEIIYRQFQLAKTMSQKEMFQMELTLAVQCSRHPDFAEGVRALLIDKDNQPSWEYAVMGEVPASWIDEHFENPWGNHPMADL